MDTSQNTIAGLIEYRGQIIAAHVPVALLIMDAASYALARAAHNRLEALDLDFTVEERAERLRRAGAIEAWANSNCAEKVAFDDDVTLYFRSVFAPVVVTRQNLEAYLDAVLAVSTVFTAKLQAASQFFLHSNANGKGAELWLTDNRKLRAPCLHPSPEIRIVETSADDLKAIIACQQQSRFATTATTLA